MIVDFRRTPPPSCSLPTHHHEQHCDCTGVIQIPGHHHLPGPEVGQSHWVHGEKGPAAAVLPSPAEEVQPATWTADTALICHHWIRPLHVNNCLVQLSYQIWSQKTTEGSPDSWSNHWYNPPHSPRAVLIQREQKSWKNHIQHTPLWTITVWSTLQSSEHQNDQTQEQFLSPSNPSHEHLTLNVEHTTLLYIIYSPHILIFSFQMCTYQTCTHIMWYIIYCVFVILYIAYLYICILFFYNLCPVLLLSFCCTVELLSL